MAVIQEVTVTSFEKLGTSSGVITQAITPFSIGASPNVVTVVRLYTWQSSGTVAAPISVTAPFGVFANVATTKFFNDKICLSIWVCVNPTPITSATITITLDRTTDFLLWFAASYANAYQGGAPTSVKTAASSNGNSSLIASHDTYSTNSLLCDIIGVYIPPELSAIPAPLTEVNGQYLSGTYGSPTIGVSLYHKLSPAVPQESGYTVSDNGGLLSTLMSIEIFPDDYVAPIPPTDGIDGRRYCPYVELGYVRKLVSNVSGLDHLEGEQVSVQVDGLPEESQIYTVVDGSLDSDLPNKGAVIHVGLPYTGRIKLLKASDGNPQGTGQTKMRRIFQAGIRVSRSLGFKVGLDESHLDPVILGKPKLPLYTGDIKKLPNTKWKDDAQLTIIQDKPMPLFILALINQSEVEDI